MNNKIYVGGLSWDTKENGLREAFEEFGDIEELNIITDRDTGRSRGFGFITFATQEGAEKALSMNGQEVDGRTLRVNYAQEREKRSGGGGGGGGRGGRGGGRRF